MWRSIPPNATSAAPGPTRSLRSLYDLKLLGGELQTGNATLGRVFFGFFWKVDDFVFSSDDPFNSLQIWSPAPCWTRAGPRLKNKRTSE